MCCSLLQCAALSSAVAWASVRYVAVCCDALQYVAMCCGMLRCVAVRCGKLWYVAACCNAVQYVAVCCGMLRYVVLCYSMLQYAAYSSAVEWACIKCVFDSVDAPMQMKCITCERVMEFVNESGQI